MKNVNAALLAWYRTYGRSALPWRVVRDPYYTVVSEFMLQQTQVERVVPAFGAFVARFPDFPALAKATVADVLRAWKGLGYNSRAVRLKRLADAVLERHAGAMPRDRHALRALPGVGPYTASAIRAFAFDEPEAACDVNVRRVVHRVFFGIEFPSKASLVQLDACANDAVAPNEAHDWNSAVMDLGATVCTARAPKCLLCPLQHVCAAAPIDPVRLDALRTSVAKVPPPQAALPFKMTTRFVRGRVVDHLRELPSGAVISLLDLHRELRGQLQGRSVADVRAAAEALSRDGVVDLAGDALRLRH